MRAVPRSLFGHLMWVQIVYGGLLALGFLLVLGLTHTRYHLEATQRLRLGWAGEILSRYQKEFTSTGLGSDNAPLRELLVHLGRSSLAFDFHVIDGSGRILLSSVPTAELRRASIDIGAVESLIQNPKVLPVMIEDPTEPGVSRIFSAASLDPGARPKAYLLLLLRGLDAGTFLSHQGSRVFLESVAMMAGVSVLAFAAALVLLVSILRPVRKLSRAMETFRRESGIVWGSEYGEEEKSKGSELDRLSLHFNEMARQIMELLHQLKDDDRKMREMFANSSHDLRTPLTIIQACLEKAQTTVDESLPEARRGALTDLALAQCRSLGRLIEGVFELSKLQRADYQLHREPFSIAELAQDVAMKFSAQATERGISVCIAGGNKYMDVTADVLLVERVLDNLIGNALRHAEGASEIVIRLVEQATEVEVMVCDNGCGISTAAWTRILTEQSGKAPSYPGATEKGAGLGLSIVRRILELHDTSLELLATGGKGTCFRFALRKAGCLDNPQQSPLAVTALPPVAG